MQANEYEKMFEFERDFWWHKGKFFLVKNFVKQHVKTDFPQKIMEIGCGGGVITTYLRTFGDVTGVDISPDAIEACSSQGLNDLICADINSYDIEPFKAKFDYIFALDVLEHIQDDLETMRRAHQMLKPGGYFVVNVPAHKFLWSEHDEALHHKRRYHRLEITQKLKDTGFKIDKVSYFVATAFFPILVIRTWNTFFKKSAYPKTSYMLLPKAINNFATFVMRMEAALLNHISLPIGSTLTVIARKVEA